MPMMFLLAGGFHFFGTRTAYKNTFGMKQLKAESLATCLTGCSLLNLKISRGRLAAQKN